MAPKTNSLSKIFELNPQEFPFDKYILEKGSEFYEDNMKIIKRILTDEKNYDIIAPTGTGKTSGIISRSMELGVKFILFVPYTANVYQLENQFKESGFHLQTIYDFKSHKIDNYKFDFLVSTYDGIFDLEDSDKIDLSNYIMILDEYHNLFVQLGYRSDKILRIHACLESFKKKITITGTHEGILLNDSNPDKEIKSDIIKFVSHSQKDKFQVKPILLASLETYNLATMIQKHSHKKFVLYFDRIKKLKSIEDFLISKLKIKRENISIVTSKAKKVKNSNNYVWNNIINEELLPKETKILLCTSVICDGVNILNKDFEAIYVCGENNLIKFRQFFRRFRNFSGIIYDVLEYKKFNKSKYPWPEYYEIIHYNKNLLEQLSKQVDKLFLAKLKKGSYPDNFFIDTMLKMFSSYVGVYYDKPNQRIVVNIYRVLFEKLNHFFYITSKNLTNRKEYLEEFENIEVIEKENFDVVSKYDNIKSLNKTEYKRYIDLYKNKFDFCKLYLKEKYPAFLVYGVKTNVSGYSKFLKENKDILENINFEKYLMNKIGIEFFFYLHPELLVESEKLTSAKYNKFLSMITNLKFHIWEKSGIDLEKYFHPISKYEIYKALITYIKDNRKLFYEEFIDNIDDYLNQLGLNNSEPKLTAFQLWEQVNLMFIVHKRSGNRKKDKATRFYEFEDLDFDKIINHKKFGISNKRSYKMYFNKRNKITGESIKNSEGN